MLKFNRSCISFQTPPMEKCLFLLLVHVSLVHYFLVCSAMEAPTNLTTDQSTLLTLKAHITSDPYNILTYNWSKTSTSCCDWIGVTCGNRHQRVTSLNLGDMGLIGTIPPHIGNLSFLASLDMGNNSFHGHLPNQLAFLRRLKVINLINNYFSGELPSWFDHLPPNLRFLSLSFNNFSGTIPHSICNVSKLEILQLTNNQLRGYIPEEIGRLTRLKILFLFGNNLSGPIPSSIYNMSSLQNLDLSRNSLSGSLPTDMCGHLPKLEVLYLQKNQLYGKMPSTLPYCRRLQKLVLSFNNFTGSIPKGISNLTRLELLLLAYNSFKGEIPQELGNLQNLKEIHLHSNGLSGSIPPNLFNISTLEIISLSNNHLSGQLPSTIGFGLPNLGKLYLWRNNISGIIPYSISNASQLTILNLNNNSFTGFIPNTLGSLTLLEWFTVAVNSLSLDSRFLSSLTNCRKLRNLQISLNSWNDILPISIGNFSTSLESFVADGCNIKGHIPREIGNLSNLISLSLRNNKLTGPIPSTIGRLEELQYLDFSDNKLQSSIPSDLCLLRRLANLYLYGNELSGPILACIGNNLTSLLELRLNSNKLTSTVPSTFSSLTNIVLLDLSSNSLSGNLPLEIGSLKMVSDIDMSMNNLSGNIPSTIGSLQSLLTLSLAHNKLQGQIPPSFKDLRSLEFLDLSDNNLSGAIPESFEKLRYLKILDVSSNRLQGIIPNGGPFANFSAESFKLNAALCGAPRFQVPPCKTDTSRRSSTTIIILTLKYVLPAIVITVLVLLLVLMRCRKRDVRTPSQAELLSLPWRRISYPQIVQASNGFSETNLLGIGSFGSVYKGILSDGVNIAVKVFNLQLEGAFKSFDVECEVLRSIRHRNLIKIISSCSNNLDFKALVLEYMPNGSLEKWLYSHNHFLDILQRLNIMIDVSLALKYLHHDYSMPIVHCDLKPSNILLDGNMVAHVGDFGIAKLLGEGEFMKQTITLATIGYMAPEYGTEGIVSTRGDVFSYGIMLMEVFTRKKPTDESFSEDMNLKRWVSYSLRCGSVTEVVDSNLLGGEEEHFVAKDQCVSSVLSLAMDCTADSPEERISMKVVVAALMKIKSTFLAQIGGVDAQGC